MASPLVDGGGELENKDVTADALRPQRTLATSLVGERTAHDHVTVKGPQPTLFDDRALFCQNRRAPDCIAPTPATRGHGRDAPRRIWVTSELNDALPVPHVGHAVAIERTRLHRKTGTRTQELVSGITSRTKDDADAQRLLEINRGHWAIEHSCPYGLDWNDAEARRRSRTGAGPENVTRLPRLAIRVIHAVRNAVRTPRPASSVAQTMRELASTSRLVFDSLRRTQHSCASARR